MTADIIRVVLADDHTVVRAGLKAVLSAAKDIRRAMPRFQPEHWPANAALLRLRDGTWAIRKDRLRNARAVADRATVSAGGRTFLA